MLNPLTFSLLRLLLHIVSPQTDSFTSYHCVGSLGYKPHTKIQFVPEYNAATQALRAAQQQIRIIK